MKRVLVTGAEGFIGSHLVETLLERGYEVNAFVLYNSLGSTSWLEGLDRLYEGKLRIFFGDVRDKMSLRPAMLDCQQVFHLAALIAIPYSYVAYDSYMEVNAKGTLRVMELAREMQVERVLVTSTSEVYGTAEYVPMDEKHPLKAQSPYSASKIAADKVAESFYCSFGLPISIVRPFNTYGPRQSARAFIPSVITQLLAGLPTLKLGNLQPTRDLVFVKDTALGFVKIAEAAACLGETVHIATQQEISMGELAMCIAKLMNKEVQIVQEEQRQRKDTSEVFRLLGSNAKLLELCNWKPAVSLEDGLKASIEWFSKKENLLAYKPHLYHV